MARSRRTSAPSRSSSRSASTSRTSSTPATQPQAAVAQTAPRQPGLIANMASTAAGVAIGSTIGHTIGHGITSMFGGSSQPVERQEPVQQQFSQNPCEADQKAFMNCLDKNSNEISGCQFYLDMLKQCQANARTNWA